MRRVSTIRFKFVPVSHQGLLLVKATALLIGLACALHLAIGSHLSVVCLSGLILLISIYPIAVFGFLNMGGILVALVGFRYAGFPFFAKLAMAQPLDSNLMDPIGTYTIVLLGLLGYITAFLMSKRFSVGRPILKLSYASAISGRISFMAAAIGIAANFTVAFRAGDEYTGLTIAEFFVSFLHLALISAIARTLQASGRKRSIDAWVVLLLVLEIIFAMVVNSRMALMETFLCFIVTVIAFEATIKWKQFIVTVTAICMMVIFVTPVFLYVRDSRDNLSWTQRIHATIKMAARWPEAFAYYQKNRDIVDRLGWHLNYYGSPQNVFERMTLVNHVDVLKAGSDSYGKVGLEDLNLSLGRAMPRLLWPNKPRDYSQGSWLYEKIGFFNLSPFATAPLIGAGFAAFGWGGAFFYPFILSLIWLLFLKKISGWNIQGNVWAIYLLLRVHNQFVEGSSGAYLLYMLRSLPQDLVLLWIVGAVAQGRFLPAWRKKVIHVHGK